MSIEPLLFPPLADVPKGVHDVHEALHAVVRGGREVQAVVGDEGANLREKKSGFLCNNPSQFFTVKTGP